MCFNDVAIVTAHFWFIAKGEAVNKMKNSDLSKKRGQL